MSDFESFRQDVEENIRQLGSSEEAHELTDQWINCVAKYNYTHNFRWLGLPIIQFPQDILAMQELIWEVKPELIIETGIARGGSLIFYASMLQLLGRGDVLGIDIDIRNHNKRAIEAHPLFERITMIEGSSIDDRTLDQVKAVAGKYERIMVSLDSSHTHEHVLTELEHYAPLVSKGSYCVVFDTIIEDMPPESFPDRPWGRGDNPKTAVKKFLANHSEFEVDQRIENKLLITVAPHGFLKRIC